MWVAPELLEDVVSAGLCVGCGLCADGEHVDMQLSEQGHLRPRVKRPIPLERLRRVLACCPGAVIGGPQSSLGTDPLWGPVLSQHRGFAADPEYRFRGSSGGVISAIAAYLLRSGEVEYVLQIGAATGSPLRSQSHLSRSAAEILAHAGSRYAPAATLDGIEALLRRAQRFAVIAKPCEIAALRELGRQDPRVDLYIPYMLSFFCAGVPGQNGTREALRRMGTDEAGVTSLRYRGDGWPGRMTVQSHSGEASLSYRELWGDVLHHHLQFRCKICPDGSGELADIVAADAWATSDGLPDFDERDGISALLSRTVRGRALLEACVDAGVIVVDSMRLADLAAMQPYQVRRKRTVLARLAGLAAIGRKLPRYRRMRLASNALQAGPFTLLRAFAGTMLRAWSKASRG